MMCNIQSRFTECGYKRPLWCFPLKGFFSLHPQMKYGAVYCIARLWHIYTFIQRDYLWKQMKPL